MQKHGNGILIGLTVLLLIAVIFFGIVMTNAIDARRFAMENLQKTMLEIQDQSMFGMQPFMTQGTNPEELRKIREQVNSAKEELKKVTESMERQKSVNPEFTQEIMPSLLSVNQKLDDLIKDLQSASAAAFVPGANAQYYDRNAQSGDRIVEAIATDLGNLNPITVNEATVSSFWDLPTVLWRSTTMKNRGSMSRFWRSPGRNRRTTVHSASGCVRGCCGTISRTRSPGKSGKMCRSLPMTSSFTLMW